MVAFTAGAVLTAANLNTAFNALTFRAVTGTSDTLVLADNGGAVSYSNASAITATVPPFSSVAYANGTVIQLLNLGAGVVTITAGVGVTLNGSVVTLAQNAGGTLIKTATNTWYFLPNASAGRTLISTTSLSGASVSLTSIPSTYRNLTLYILSGRSSSNAEIRLTWTGSTNFRTVQARYVPGIATDVRGLNDGFGYLSIGGVTAAGTGLQAIANIFEANNAASRKVMHVVLGGEMEGVGSAGNTVSSCTDSTAAIATITITPSAGSFNQGTVYLYGSD
jgi:hypothetical protein